MLLKLSLIVSSLLVPVLGQAASLLQNGDFEQGTTSTVLNFAGGGSTVVDSPLSWLSDPNFRGAGKGWGGQVVTVTSAFAEYTLPYDLAPDDKFLMFTSPGDRFAPSGAGPDLLFSTVSLFQEFDTVPGATYVLGYDLAGALRTASTAPTISMGIRVDNVTAGAVSQNLAEDTHVWTFESLGWEFQRCEYTFTASGTTSRLTFKDMTSYQAGAPQAALIDNISVTLLADTPEPSGVSCLLVAFFILGRKRSRAGVR